MRQSNLELLRIVSMMLVLTLHADFWSLGVPSWSEIDGSPAASLTRMTLAAAAHVSGTV